jgi:hypothetical protein
MKRLLTRAGVAGFAFFFLKGMVWLTIFIVAAIKVAEH